MTRTLTVATILAALALVFFYALADADAQTTFLAMTSGLLFIVIVFVVLLTSGATALVIRLFSKQGDRIMAGRLHRFLGWKLIRSQRQAATWGTGIRAAVYAVRARTTKRALGLVAVGAACIGLAWLLTRPAPFNAVADSVSPDFATALQLTALVLGALFAIIGLVRILVPTRATEPPTPVIRQRSAVTLPTFISIVGVAVGVWALIVVLGVMNGLQSDQRDKILRTNAHVVIEPAEPGEVIPDARALEDAVRALPAVVEAHAFVYDELMLSSPSNNAVITLKGMTPRAVATSNQLDGRIVSGSAEWLSRPEALIPDRYRFPLGMRRGDLLEDGPGDDDVAPLDLPGGNLTRRAEVMPGIMVGAELARKLAVDVGDEVHLICSECGISPAGTTARQRSFRVAAVFRTGMYQYDQRLAYIALDEAQRFLNFDRFTNRLEARLESSEDTGDVLPLVAAALHGDPTWAGLQVSDWQERDKTLFAALGLERLVMFIVLAFIILVASFLIVSSLAMLVVEKVKEIAVLKALGTNDRSIVRAFVIIGTFIAFFGCLSGVLLGVGTAQTIVAQGVSLPREFYIAELPVRLDAYEIIVVAVAALTICLLATLYPAYQASKLRPSDGFRHG